jgi:hypothetical protein
MAEIVELRKPVCEDELEEMIHRAFLKRQDLMRKVPIMDERITRIDMWMLQQKLPLDILIGLLRRCQPGGEAHHAPPPPLTLFGVLSASASCPEEVVANGMGEMARAVHRRGRGGGEKCHSVNRQHLLRRCTAISQRRRKTRSNRRR